MSKEVTLQEVSDELARFPQVMMMPRDPRIDAPATTITFDDLQRAQGEFPKLMQFLELARQDANAYSSLDSEISQVNYLEITNKHSRPIASLISNLSLEAPTNAYLARQFELALEIPVHREGVMHMHEKMPSAFKAYDEAVQNANHFVTPFAQDAIINNARQHIVDGIREGSYPEVKQLQAISEPLLIQESSVTEIVQ